MPFIGSEYILFYTVSVDSSVDTDIFISSQWRDSTGMLVSAPTITSTTERLGDLQQWIRSNLTFRPLRSEDNGTYIHMQHNCNFRGDGRRHSASNSKHNDIYSCEKCVMATIDG